jgi:hypothetical protein
LTLERKDNDLGYTPANCTWVDRKTQSRNRRATRLTIDAATEIRKKHAAGATQISLAAIYKVGPTQISNIVHHRKWV